MENIMIAVHNLKKSFSEQLVLNELHFQVERGSIFALLGENGSGKTTTVRILSTLIHADSGTAQIGGFDTKKDSFTVRKMISLTGQFTAVDELLTGEENLMMMARLNHLDRKTARLRTEELLKQFDLVKVRKKLAKTYSGGMRRRLDIAISLITTRQVIFLDEPTTGLDPRSRKEMWTFINELADSGVTIFLTTQYLEEADQLADKIAILDGGKIIKEGTAEELKGMVGEEKLVIQFKTLDDMKKASLIIDPQVDKENLIASIPTNGSTETLRLTLNTLNDIGIEPSSVEFQKPTLDDVFMKLTRNNKVVVKSNV